MRGFIDRAIDFERLKRFSDWEMPAVRGALGLYHAIRAHFQITEEDSENIENLLSLADLVDRLIANPPVEELRNPELPDQLRRFIEAVITKSVSIASPTSPNWPEGTNSASPYGSFVRTLAYLGRRVTVITLNYDCVLEYTCHCLGLPFTYHRDGGRGLEILKLHGSSNWVRCRTEGCDRYGNVMISEIRHSPTQPDTSDGFIERVRSSCDVCGNIFSPVIIAPTWAKSFDVQLKRTWTRAIEAVASAEVLVAVGISLPESDAHLREFLHIGLASSKLRQALAIVGSDEAAGQRWSTLFRESWRKARFEVRHAPFERMLDAAIKPALGVPADFGGPLNQSMLPVSIGFKGMTNIEARLRQGNLDPDGVNWGAVLRQIRQGNLKNRKNQKLVELQLDWKPEDLALPEHEYAMP